MTVRRTTAGVIRATFRSEYKGEDRQIRTGRGINRGVGVGIAIDIARARAGVGVSINNAVARVCVGVAVHIAVGGPCVGIAISVAVVAGAREGDTGRSTVYTCACRPENEPLELCTAEPL